MLASSGEYPPYELGFVGRCRCADQATAEVVGIDTSVRAGKHPQGKGESENWFYFHESGSRLSSGTRGTAIHFGFPPSFMKGVTLPENACLLPARPGSADTCGLPPVRG